MVSISESFGNLGLAISREEIINTEKFAIHFLLRRTHPLTFNGMTLGVHPVAWTTADYNTLFDIFGIRKQDVEMAIRNTPSIDRTYHVQSDPFNLLCMWLVHLAPIYIKDKIVCHDFQMNILKLFHYKIFCSVVNNSFRHGANEGVSASTVAKLSKKSDVVRLESWGKVIDLHCERILNPEKQFYQILLDGSPDDAFLRVVGESQTAIRAKIVTYAQAYYETHANGESVISRSSISQNAEGEKIIAQTASVIDSATAAMTTELLNPNVFIHDVSISDVAKMFGKTISPRMLKTALLRVNETAVLQTSSRTLDKTDVGKDGTSTYHGMRALVMVIIRAMIRTAREKRVNLGNKALVFDTMKNSFNSSRNMDADVVDIKRSMGILIDSFNITQNEASRSALRLATIYYILYRVLQKMKA